MCRLLADSAFSPKKRDGASGQGSRLTVFVRVTGATF